MKKQKFEEYLQERFLTDLPELCQNKDMMISNYEKWLEVLQIDEWIKLATEWEAVINF